MVRQRYKNKNFYFGMIIASQIVCQRYKNKNFYLARFGTVYATKINVKTIKNLFDI